MNWEIAALVFLLLWTAGAFVNEVFTSTHARFCAACNRQRRKERVIIADMPYIIAVMHLVACWVAWPALLHANKFSEECEEEDDDSEDS